MTDRDLVDGLLALAREGVPDADRARIDALIADTIAIATYARVHRLGAAAIDEAALAAPGDGAIWGSRARATPALAAFLNGTAAEVLDFQEVMLRGRNNGHAAVVIVPALLALAALDRAHPGRLHRAMRVAFAANLVLLEGLGRGHREGGPGFRTTSLGAPVAAALGGSVLLGLGDEAAFHALAIAATSLPAGLLAAMSPDIGSFSSDKDLSVGFSARHAVDCVLLARAGATGPAAPLTGSRGWLASYGFATADVGRFDVALARAALAAYAIKRYPANFGCQAAIRAAIALRARVPLADIARIEVTVKSSSARSLSTRAISNHLAARFSIAYSVASALARGRSVLEDFEEPAIADRDVLALMARCEVAGDAAFEARHHATGAFPARVRLTRRDGRADSQEHDGPWDGMDAAAQAEALQAKLAALVPNGSGFYAAVRALERDGLAPIEASLLASAAR